MSKIYLKTKSILVLNRFFEADLSISGVYEVIFGARSGKKDKLLLWGFPNNKETVSIEREVFGSHSGRALYMLTPKVAAQFRTLFDELCDTTAVIINSSEYSFTQKP